MLNRAYATLEIKSWSDDERIIEGIASTPEPDRRGDILEPLGAEFTLPMPLLWQHKTDAPVGEVFEAHPGPDGIRIRAKFCKVDEPGALKDRLDEAWQSVRAKLVRGLSVGFKPLDAAPIKKGDPFGGFRVKRWQWAELSAVTLAMNVAATITAIKSAAIGDHPPGDSGFPVVRAMKGTPPMNQTTQEQITSFESTRGAKAARMLALMSAAGEGSVTLDERGSEEYDTLDREVKSIDVHLGRLRNLESLNLAAAKPIAPAPAPHLAPVAPITVKANVPPGTAFVRLACAKLVCNGNLYEAAEYAQRWKDSTPEVALALKAAIAPGTTTDATWAGPLVNQNIADDFIALLRPATILGKIAGLRNVPFNTKIPSQTAGGSYGWVGEQKPKPVTKLAFASEALGIAKAAGIIVLTEELVRLSNPSAEALARNDMIAGIAQFLDSQFIDPAVAAVAGVNPASVTNGAATAAATANPVADIMGLIAHFTTNGISPAGVHIIMSPTNALAMSFRTNLDGSPLFPGVGLEGGSYRGLTFVTSMAAQALVVALQPAMILYADDGGVTIDASREASLQMDSAPASPADATTVLVSLWQNNCVGLRAERFVNWKRVGASVKYLTAAAYPAPTGELPAGMVTPPTREGNGHRARE
jgi:HK97 family phage major capsid protein/HK97 family phage prohead protease